MSIRSFFKLVEVQTKIASMFPFLIGLLYVIYRYEHFNHLNTVIFFISLLLIDLTTTAINNYMDYKKASSDDYRIKHNVIGQNKIPLKWVKIVIFTMLIISNGLGIWLVFRTDLVVLMVGALSFGIGIFYTFGPAPLSRMPLGELFSGLTMGFGIIFLTVHVNMFNQGIISLSLDGATVLFEANLILLTEIFLVSLPSVLTISNIMLANNICDLEEDIENLRYTLPYYIGKRNAVRLFNVLYILAFIILMIVILLNILPRLLLISLLSAYPVYKNVVKFNKLQSKQETFSVSIKNLVIINGAIVILLIISI